MEEKYKIYNDDCIKIMETMEDNSVDIIITDPPYILDVAHSAGVFRKAKKNISGKIKSFSYDFDYKIVFEEFLRICKVPNFFIFCSNKQISRTMSFFESKKLNVTLLVWRKLNPIPTCYNKYIDDLEFIVYVRGKGALFINDLDLRFKHKLYESNLVSGKEKVHPTQKSVSHIQIYIELHSLIGQTVFDHFMGSGTTGVAAIKSNRRFIGVEIDPNYYKSASQRIDSESKKYKLF
jgi:DNA modification methylase